METGTVGTGDVQRTEGTSVKADFFENCGRGQKGVGSHPNKRKSYHLS